MKIGLDIHNCIDIYPELFKVLTKVWKEKNYEIHILTGQEEALCIDRLEEWGITYTNFFSIVDYHTAQGTHIFKRDDKEGIWMDGDIWAQSKGNYAHKVELDIHFDDSMVYCKYFPKNCTYVIVPKVGLRNLVTALYIGDSI